jgi:hypothetical protein
MLSTLSAGPAAWRDGICREASLGLHRCHYRSASIRNFLHHYHYRGASIQNFLYQYHYKLYRWMHQSGTFAPIPFQTAPIPLQRCVNPELFVPIPLQTPLIQLQECLNPELFVPIQLQTVPIPLQGSINPELFVPILLQTAPIQLQACINQELFVPIPLQVSIKQSLVASDTNGAALNAGQVSKDFFLRVIDVGISFNLRLQFGSQ